MTAVPVDKLLEHSGITFAKKAAQGVPVGRWEGPIPPALIHVVELLLNDPDKDVAYLPCPDTGVESNIRSALRTYMGDNHPTQQANIRAWPTGKPMTHVSVTIGKKNPGRRKTA